MNKYAIGSLLNRLGISSLESKFLSDHLIKVNFNKNPSEIKQRLAGSKYNCPENDNDISKLPNDVTRAANYLAHLRRDKKIPLSYIIGEQPFWKSSFVVRLPIVDYNNHNTIFTDSFNHRTLISRSDSEILVETTLKLMKTYPIKRDRLKILDIATGSGCLILSILAEGIENCNITGVGIDVSESALQIAEINAERTLGNDWRSKCSIIKGDMTSHTSQMLSELQDTDSYTFDFIISNPPYIKSDVISTLEDDVKLHEPLLALDGGTNGYLFYEEIARRFQDSNKPLQLNHNGYLLLEIGQEQEISRMKSIFERINGLNYIDTIKDNFGKGHDRLIIFQQK